MSDWADLAADREAELRADALAEQARRAAQPETISAETCRVCDGPISATRRRALPGVQTCIDCARELEHALRAGGRAPGKEAR